jgi:hypothetical protein
MTISVSRVALPLFALVLGSCARETAEKRALRQVSRIQYALMNHCADHGRYPTTKEGLKALTPADLEQAGLRRSTNASEDPFRDPWGTRIEYSDQHGHLTIRSLGKDRLRGTADDVVYAGEHK